MAQVCPSCHATVGDDATVCERCEARLDPCPTIPPARPRPGASRRSPSQERPPRRPDHEGERDRDRDESDRRPERPVAASKPKRIKPASAPRVAPPSHPAGGPPAPPPVAPSPPPTPYPGYAPYTPGYGTAPDGPPVVGGAPSEGPTGVRGWMIRMLGGKSEPAPAPPPPSPVPPPYPPQAAYPGYAPPGYPQPAYPPQGYPAQPAYPPQPQPQPAPPGQTPWPGTAPQGQPPAPQAPQPPAHETPRIGVEPQGFGTSDDDDGQTRFIGGVDVRNLNIPKASFFLQILDSSGQWSDLGPIHANGRNVGRSANSASVPGLGSMAVRHLKFFYDRTRLMVEDLGSLNGVYLRITDPVELIDGMRFRIGGQLIEFHRAEPFDQVAPLTSDEGEEFYTRDPEAPAYLDLIRPNGRPGIRLPLLNLGATVIGREGPGVNLPLINDQSVSGRHAQIRRQDSQFFLEDLKSRNGTYINLLGPHELKSGDIVQAGLVFFRVIDHSLS